jgi:hypothetical protein
VDQSKFLTDMEKRLAHAPPSPLGSRTPSHGRVGKLKIFGTSSGFVDKPGEKITFTGKAEKAGTHFFKHTHILQYVGAVIRFYLSLTLPALVDEKDFRMFLYFKEVSGP